MKKNTTSRKPADKTLVVAWVDNKTTNKIKKWAKKNNRPLTSIVRETLSQFAKNI